MECKMNLALVNYSTATGWYIEGQKRLIDTMEQFGFNGTFYSFQKTNEFGSPDHKDNPYAFKIYAIKHALNKGHDVIWWMDSSIYAVKDIAPILQIVEEKGYYFEEAGHLASTWTNDATLKYFDISRNDAENIKLFSAGFMILDFRHEIVREFFARWKNSCDAGMFKGNWHNNDKTESKDERCKGHRHDLSCASIIATKLGMDYFSGGTMLSYVGPGYATPSEKSIFHLQPPC